MNDRRPLALVTGASSGIGASYARLLAGRGFDLWLVARRRDLLETLAAEVAGSGSSCRIQEGDLSDRAFLSRLSDDVRAEPRLSFLLHNAGFGVHGQVGEADPGRLQAMADVHVSATIALCSAAAVGFRQRRSGTVVVVSSIAGWLVGAGSATYCATKAFETSFARSLAHELRPFGVRVQALCPGWTLTGFHDTPEYAHWSRSSVPRALWSRPEDVARESWDRLGRGEVCVPGRLNRLVTAVGRALPVGKIRDRLRRARRARPD